MRACGLTQHYEADGGPLVLPAVLHFAAVLPRVGEGQVADEQRGIPPQVVPAEAHASPVRIVGVVHPAGEVGDQLRRRIVVYPKVKR